MAAMTTTNRFTTHLYNNMSVLGYKYFNTFFYFPTCNALTKCYTKYFPFINFIWLLIQSENRFLKLSVLSVYETYSFKKHLTKYQNILIHISIHFIGYIYIRLVHFVNFISKIGYIYFYFISKYSSIRSVFHKPPHYPTSHYSMQTKFTPRCFTTLLFL